jgi:hypothetical protein
MNGLLLIEVISSLEELLITTSFKACATRKVLFDSLPAVDAALKIQ